MGREKVTTHALESIGIGEKEGIVINNYLGGLYFLTVDDVVLSKTNFVSLIESKHSNGSDLPSEDDIKDGLLKMILYSNIDTLYYNNQKNDFKSFIRLTSCRINGKITEEDNNETINEFCTTNRFSSRKRDTINKLIKEARENKFGVIIEYSA